MWTVSPLEAASELSGMNRQCEWSVNIKGWIGMGIDENMLQASFWVPVQNL
jgi:hypothetical protein